MKEQKPAKAMQAAHAGRKIIGTSSNGSLSNPNLRRALIQRGHTFTSSSDGWCGKAVTRGVGLGNKIAGV